LNEIELKDFIRSIPDFPKKGIIFKDITPLLNNPFAFRSVLEIFASKYGDQNIKRIVSVESRGFILGSALAYKLGVGFVPVRKPKKLPYDVIREEYQLEYGADALEIHTDAIQNGERVLIVDDLLATGGTAAAACNLVERLGGSVAGLAFLVELTFLRGREKMGKYDVFSLIQYQEGV